MYLVATYSGIQWTGIRVLRLFALVRSSTVIVFFHLDVCHLVQSQRHSTRFELHTIIHMRDLAADLFSFYLNSLRPVFITLIGYVDA